MSIRKAMFFAAGLFALVTIAGVQPASAALPDDCFSVCDCDDSCNRACVEFIGGPTVTCEEFGLCEGTEFCGGGGGDPEPEPSTCSCTTSIFGGSGNDTLSGNSSNNCIYGSGGNDSLYGNAGNDQLFGGVGNDSLYGGSGNDCLYGSWGNDYLDGGSGNDVLDGQVGYDTCVNGETNISCEF